MRKIASRSTNPAPLDRLHRRRRRWLRVHLCHCLSPCPGQPRRARRRKTAARRNPDHGRRSMLPAGHARGIQEALLQPFNWAFGVREPDRKLFAIPGNHDWYDGLNAFDSLFCSSRDKLSKPRAHHRRLAMPAAPQLLGDAPALQLVDLGRRHPVLEISRQPRRSTISRRWPVKCGPATTSSSVLPSPRG